MIKSERTEGLISIIVPVYNIESYLDKCIATILNQSYLFFELILINDGSTDDSGKICESWSERDDRIQVIHQKNAGAAAARNAGLERAKGEYLMFVDGDDYISDQLCERLLNELVESKAQCCVCGWNYVDEKGNTSESVVVENIIETTGIMALHERYLKEYNRFNTVVPWGKMFHWSMWEGLRFENGLYFEDMAVMPKLYWGCERLRCIPYVGYYYLRRIGSASNGIGRDDKRFVDMLKIREEHIEFYKSKDDMELAYALMERLLDLIITYDCRDEIPDDMQRKARESYLRYWKEYGAKRNVSSKMRMKYLIYIMFGKNVYRILAKII